MSEQEQSEQTHLLSHNNEKYNFAVNFSRKKRVQQFQCFLYAILLVAFLIALIITIAYTISVPINNNDTDGDLDTSNNSLIMLSNKKFPLQNFHEFDHYQINYNGTFNNLTLIAMEMGEKMLKNKDFIDKASPDLSINTPSYKHQKLMETNKISQNLSRFGYKLESGTYFIHKNFPRNKHEILCPNITDQFLIEMCSNKKGNICNKFRKYRSYNGSCNNFEYPYLFGVAYRPYRRTLRPDYADGISKPRVSKNGQELPSARTISLEIHRTSYKDDSKFSVMLAVWGQFLDHDITATALNTKLNGNSVACCKDVEISSPECFPIHLDKTDPLYLMDNLTCMEFVRSAPSAKCCLGVRDQMNQASAFIDGSVIYGNDENLVNSLRTFEEGLLKVFLTNDNRTLLPISEDMNDGCNREKERLNGRYCFAAGDSRANENLHLTSMHLLWVRQHNFISKKLSYLNPHWNDEKLFQETRKIISAQIQHITYSEFLPILIGNPLIKKHNLLPKKSDYFTDYNRNIDASIANEFASAAFRFAHTLIPSLVKVLRNDTTSFDFIQMHKMLFDPFKLYEIGELDKMLIGALNTSIDAADNYFSDEIKTHLFENENALPPRCGLDLVSLNIQRGRDHGLSGYTFWKNHCGLKITRKFNDLIDVIGKSTLNDIKAVYKYVEDIDLYTGGLSEKPIKGSILGPTFTCLILDQFIRLKYGDRFWYENVDVFTLNQLNEIRKISLARIICDNSDKLNEIQPLVMKGISENNKNVKCIEIPQVNLSYWKE